MALLLLTVLLFACKNDILTSDIPQLNGYWEIVEVEGPEGQSRSYIVNTTIDYLQLDGMKGFRKKVQPQLNGSFIASDDAARFEITQKAGLFVMVYRNEEQEWEEQLIHLDSTSFSVINGEGITYHYKRFKPLLSTP